MEKKQQRKDNQKVARLLKVCLVGSSQDLIDNLLNRQKWSKTFVPGFILYPVKVEDEFYKIQLRYFTRSDNHTNFLKNFYHGAYSLIFVLDTSEIGSLERIKSFFEEYLTFLSKIQMHPASNPEYPYVLLSISPDSNSLANRKAGDYAQSIKAHFIQIQEEDERIIVEILKFLASNHLEYFKKLDSLRIGEEKPLSANEKRENNDTIRLI